jgi:hypothetical protein
MEKFTRKEFLDYTWKMLVLTTFGVAVPACNTAQSGTPTSKPKPYEIPTMNPSDSSPYRDLARFYPILDSLSINGEPTSLKTTVPTTIYNFTRNRTIDSDSAKRVYDYFESLAILNRSVDYSYHFRMFDQSVLQLTKRPVRERFTILVPSDGPSLPTNSLSKPEEVTAVTIIDDKEPTKIRAYTFIKLDDILDADQSSDPSDFRKFVTEVCQSTIYVKLKTDMTAYVMGYQNLGQEIVCNSISFEIENRHKNVPYETHREEFRSMGIFGFPVIVSSQKDYLLMPQLGEILK